MRAAAVAFDRYGKGIDRTPKFRLACSQSAFGPRRR